MTRPVAVLLALLAPGASALAAGVAVSTVQVPEGHTLESVFVADAGGDERGDLVLVLAGPARRSLHVHLRQDGETPFAGVPDHTRDLPADVTACAVGDVHPHPGPEFVLFAPRRVFAVWIDPAEGERPGARLLDADLLWQLPDPRAVVVWQDGLVDLDGDGRTDLIVPGPQGYRIAFRRDAGATDRVHDLVLPSTPPRDLLGRNEERLADPSDGDFNISINLGDDERTPMLLTVNDQVPAPHAADWDADGDLDIIVQTDRKLLVWVQDPPGTLPATPTLALDLPVKIDWPGLDMSYRSHLVDIDVDGRADYVLTANDRFAKETRAQVLPYLQTTGDPPLFRRDQGPPRALLPSGFVPASQLYDVDGDDRPDLVLLTFRPEDLGSSRGDADAIRAELFVYRNDGRGFDAAPMLRHAVRLNLDGGDSTARFLVDLTGDGVHELVIRDEPDRLRVLPVVRDRKGSFTVRDTPLWTLAVDPEAEIEWVDTGPKHGEFLVVEEHQVTHVRLR